MPTQLIVTEKPRVAQKLASALSGGKDSQKKGKSGISYFEFKSGNNTVFVAPAVGHVYTLMQKEKKSGYPVFDIEWVESSLADEKAAFTKKYLSNLKELAKKSDELVNACDWDVEGSLIGGNVIRFAGKGKAAKRMLFSTLTTEDLQSAYAHLSPLDTPQIDAGEARHILDWYWGINCSRALMQAIRSAGIFKILSIGRVQGPALKILAKRELEISEFKPVPFWQLFAVLKKTKFVHETEKFFDEKEAQAAYSDAKSAKDAAIESAEKKKYEALPPVPFDLTSLQLEAYRLFKISPTQTLAIAQDLYEEAVISYPRTSSQKLSVKLGLDKIISKLSSQSEYASLCKMLQDNKRFVPREGEKEDKAHPAIHPTGLSPGKLDSSHQKLYDLIVRRFLACFAPSAIREKTLVKARISQQLFVVSGAVTVEKGWIEFYGSYAKLDEDELPPFTQGEKVVVEKLDKEQALTQPPKRYTPASIIKKLESKGLGTKATRASIVETLFGRGYLAGKSIEVTPLGMAVFSSLKAHVFPVLSSKLTRAFEEETEAIQEGKISKEAVIARGRGELSKILEKFKLDENEIGKELVGAVKQTEKEASTLGPCTRCSAEGRIGESQGQLQIRRSKFGLFVGCSKYPDCRQTYPLPRGALVKPVGKPCEKCGTPIIAVIRKGKRPFNMCLDPTCETKKDWGAWKKKEEKPAEPSNAAGSPPSAALPIKKSSVKPKPSASYKPSEKTPSAKPSVQPKQ